MEYVTGFAKRIKNAITSESPTKKAERKLDAQGAILRSINASYLSLRTPNISDPHRLKETLEKMYKDALSIRIGGLKAIFDDSKPDLENPWNAFHKKIDDVLDIHTSQSYRVVPEGEKYPRHRPDLVRTTFDGTFQKISWDKLSSAALETKDFRIGLKGESENSIMEAWAQKVIELKGVETYVPEETQKPSPGPKSEPNT